MPAQICYFFRVCIFILRTYVRTCRIPPHRRTQKGFPLRGSCRRSRLMRRSVVRSELSPRFGKAKAPLGDQGELSAKLTERIRTLLFRLYQRRNVTGQRIRLLRIRIGAVLSATPLLHNSSVACGDSSFYTKEPLDRANALHLKNLRSPPHPPPAGAPSPQGEGIECAFYSYRSASMGSSFAALLAG